MLRDRRILDSRGEPVYSITLISQQILNISTFTSANSYLHVRVKELGILPDEYEKHCSAWRAFPDYVPEPLGRSVNGEWEIFVVRGIPHRSVLAGSIAVGKRGLIPQLARFIDESTIGARVANPVESHTNFLGRVLARTSDPVCSEIIADSIASKEIDKLPHVYQHGDFVVNNLGLAAAGLVVFDWEDFARIELAGFDLCTLIASDTAFDPNVLRQIMLCNGRAGERYSKLLNEACASIGLEPQMFRRLIPLYLAIFLDLKSDRQNYGPAIRQLVRKAIHRVGAADAHDPAATPRGDRTSSWFPKLP
jgi:hypothetical protein